VGGQYLEGVTQAQYFGGGISAKVVDYLRPTNQKEEDEYKVELEKLQEKRKAAARPAAPPAPTPLPKPVPTANPASAPVLPASSAPAASPSATPAPVAQPATPSAPPPEPKPVWTPEDEKRVEELRQKLAYRMNRQTAPAICEAVVLEVTIAPDAAIGDREVRIRNANGLSNPMLFQVGMLEEFTEPAAFPNTMAPEGRNPDNPRRVPSSPERTIKLPAIVNGQILPGGVDRIRFTATKGQKVVIAARARALIPYLADAVPGWFQATLALYDTKGHELAYDDRFQFNPDPVLYYEIRTDGEYVIEIKDSIYRGR
jgi:hypothetical protein